MQQLISFLKMRLQQELPHQDIRKEGLSDNLLRMLLESEVKRKEQFEVRPPRICAVMIAFFPGAADLHIPMMLRPDNIRAHPGQISFPGGRQEPQDEDLAATAIREMHEEVGVAVPRAHILGELTPVYIPPSNSLVTPVIGYLNDPPSYIPQQEEVAEAFDVSLRVLRDPENRRNKRVTLADGGWIDMPAYQAGPRFIWGGTARMISELIKVLADMDPA